MPKLMVERALLVEYGWHFMIWACAIVLIAILVYAFWPH
jgi:hypothetical protein